GGLDCSTRRSTKKSKATSSATSHGTSECTGSTTPSSSPTRKPSVDRSRGARRAPSWTSATLANDAGESDLLSLSRIPPIRATERGEEGLTSVTVGERILVHLSGFLRHADAYECPIEMTQDGIAASLALSRAHVALEL